MCSKLILKNAPQTTQRCKHATFLSHRQIGSEHFTCLDSDFSQVFKVIVSTSKKILNNTNVVV